MPSCCGRLASRGTNRSERVNDTVKEYRQHRFARPPGATEILLIRHGENEYVKKGKLAGRLPGVHLNEKGRKQAENLAQALANQPIKAIYSSPLDRTMETPCFLLVIFLYHSCSFFLCH